MRKRVLAGAALVAYAAMLIKVMVFKDIPMIRIGHLMLNFGGTDANGQANFVPFKTIVPYLLGYKGWIIAGINLAGNVGLLVPVGFLVPFVWRNSTWRGALAVAIASGLSVEGMQVLFNVGIFDIDDVILNGFGVIIGYGLYKVLQRLLSR